MPPPPNTRPILLLLLLAALLLATASSTAAMQLFPMASHPEVDACVDAEADERRLLQHDHCDRGGVSTCGVDDPVMTRHPSRRWPAVVDSLRRSVRDTTARAREGLRRARLRHRAAARASSEETPAADDDEDDDDEGAHHAAQRDTLAAIVDTLEDIERQLFLAAPSRRAASRAPAPLAALRDRALSWLGRGPDKTHGTPPDSATTNRGLVDWQRDLLFKTAVDVVETDRAYVLRADVPGLGDEDLRVDVDDDARTLRVFGRRDDAEETNAKTKTKNAKTKNADEDGSEDPASVPTLTTPVYHARERHFGAFENTYALPPDADASAVIATVRGGVLEVTVPKRSAEAGAGTRGPRRVAVERE